MLHEDFDIETSVLLSSIGIEFAPNSVNGLYDFTGTPFLTALKEHVFEKMRNSLLSFLFVQGS